jgi:hypothetical protein
MDRAWPENHGRGYQMELTRMKLPPRLLHFAPLNTTNDYGSFTPTFSCHWLPCVVGRMGCWLYFYVEQFK